MYLTRTLGHVLYLQANNPRGTMTVTTTVRPDVFMFLKNPNDDECRYVQEFGNIEFEFADSVLKLSEDTYGDEGTLLTFLTEYLGTSVPG